MSKTSKSTKLFLLSALGVLTMGVLLVAVNLLAGLFHGRLDLTENQLFTLSPGTAAVLQKMDTPVTVRFYYSRENAQMPAVLKAYAQRIEDLLSQYRTRSGGKVKVQLLSPAPDSDAEDAARLDGVAGQPLPNGEAVYLGAAISCLDQTVTLPVLSPDRESLLEYDLTRAIYRVLHPEKPVLGLMSSLPISGQQMQMFMMPNAGGAEPPWTLYSELKSGFTVTEIPVTTDTIPANVKVLLLIHPRELSDPTLYALDQFVLRGGRLLAFLDPLCWAESKGGNPMSSGLRAPPGPSTLGKLLNTWGVAFDPEKIVADLGTMLQVQGRAGNPERMPALLGLRRENLDAGDPALAALDSV
ncbi:MAG: GldG family protein, partial [bacterium]